MNKFKSPNEIINELEEKVEKLQQALLAAADDLCCFGTHEWDCGLMRPSPACEPKCDCGLEEVINHYARLANE